MPAGAGNKVGVEFDPTGDMAMRGEPSEISTRAATGVEHE
jgi:hypothetical protein